MRKYTTPTLVMSIPADLTDAHVYVTIKQDKRKIEKSGTDVIFVYDPTSEKTELSVTLTQEETGQFYAEDHACVQVNWIFTDGTRQATNIERIKVLENLKVGVITYD